jgi:IS1 family transposase
MNALTRQEYAAIIRCLCEGNSVASTTRITGAAKNTILGLLQRAGEASAEYMREHLVNLPCKRVEIDEIWSFVGRREKEDPKKLDHNPAEGSVWVWKCVCAETKLIVHHHVGGRTFDNAVTFCRGFAHRFAKNPQISSDGLPSYPLAIAYAFGDETVDYGRLIKSYGRDKNGLETCVGARRESVYGNPDMSTVRTSYVERANLTTRMQNRRFTRKTNAHSKIVGNHRHMLALGFMHYNFCRKHQTLKQTPAQAAEVTDHQWSVEEIVDVMEAREEALRCEVYENAFAVWEERKVLARKGSHSA